MPEQHPTLYLTTAHFQTMLAQARQQPGQEVCGLLGGEITGREWRCRICLPVDNVSPTPATTYMIDPAALVAAHYQLAARDQRLIGVYHSHPGGDGALSPTDIQQATYPDFAYCVLYPAPTKPDFRLAAWHIVAEQVIPMKLILAG